MIRDTRGLVLREGRNMMWGRGRGGRGFGGRHWLMRRHMMRPGGWYGPYGPYGYGGMYPYRRGCFPGMGGCGCPFYLMILAAILGLATGIFRRTRRSS